MLRSEAELWSKGNLDVADELYGADFICHFVGGTEWKSSRTQRGEFAGVAPNGEKVTIHEAAIYRVVAGKIVEQWSFPDSQSLKQPSYRRCDAGNGLALSWIREMIYARMAATSFAVRIFWNEGIPSDARAPPSRIDSSESSVSLLA